MGKTRARQSIVTDIRQQQQLRHRHRHGHRHRHRHRHRSVIVVSSFVFVFVSKTKAARKCSTRIVAWLPQCEVCLIMHISSSSSPSPAPVSQPCSVLPPDTTWAGAIPARLAHKQVSGYGRVCQCVCEYVSVCVCVCSYV